VVETGRDAFESRSGGRRKLSSFCLPFPSRTLPLLGSPPYLPPPFYRLHPNSDRPDFEYRNLTYAQSYFGKALQAQQQLSRKKASENNVKEEEDEDGGEDDLPETFEDFMAELDLPLDMEVDERTGGKDEADEVMDIVEGSSPAVAGDAGDAAAAAVPAQLDEGNLLNPSTILAALTSVSAVAASRSPQLVDASVQASLPPPEPVAVRSAPLSPTAHPLHSFSPANPDILSSSVAAPIPAAVSFPPTPPFQSLAPPTLATSATPAAPGPPTHTDILSLSTLRAGLRLAELKLKHETASKVALQGQLEKERSEASAYIEGLESKLLAFEAKERAWEETRETVLAAMRN
jgi:hypothetical protein